MRRIMFAAIAALAITSCSQNEEFDNVAQKAEINFGTVVSKSIRAAITDNTALQGSGFTVYAYNTGAEALGTSALPSTPYMDGLQVTYAAPNWGYSGTYYWPLSDNLQFFAYANDDAAQYSLAADGKYPTIAYTIQPLAANQKDFVIAQAADQKKQDNALALSFTHALTQVNFSASATGNLTCKITSISIEGILNQGTYSFGTKEWTASGTETSYAYLIDANNSITGTTVTPLDQPNGALMLMPQPMTASTQIKLSYQVYDKDVLINEVKDYVISLKDKAAWTAGKKIRYSLSLDNAGATISFAPDVDAWGNEEDPNKPAA